MKKQKRQFLFLLVMVIVCVAAYWGLSAYQKSEDEKKEAESTEVVCEIDTDSILSFSYQADGKTYSFKKEDGWINEEDTSLQLDDEQINALLYNVSKIDCDSVVEDPGDLSEYGLDQPSNVIKVETEKKEYCITIGDYNETSSCYYYMTNLSDKVYAGNASVCTSFQNTPDSYVKETVSENCDS